MPELEHTEIGTTSIRTLLHMASDIRFTQSYSETDDNAKLHALWNGWIKEYGTSPLMSHR